jgi:hypothetical protein
MSRLRFGIFMAPFHPAGENPTLALQRDLALVEHLDRPGLLAHEWANPIATHRSYELIAQHVMPLFQGQAQSTLDAKARATETRPGMAEEQNQAVAHMTEKYQREVAAGRT